MTIELGALCPKLSEQLAGLGIPKANLKFLDRCAEAVTLLYCQRLLSDLQYQIVRRALILKCQHEINQARANARTKSE